MPTYEYRCDECGVEFDRLQKMSDPPVTECPECGGAVRRLISKGGGLLFKGAGFYATDYKSGSGAAKKEEPASDKKVESASKKKSTGDAAGSE